MKQVEEVYEYLKKKGSITTLEAFKKLYIMDLQGVIRDLKKNYNVKITDEWLTKVNVLKGRTVRYKKYYLGGK